MPLKQLKYSFLALFPTAAGLAALFAPGPVWLRGLLALGWLSGSGAAVGQACLPQERRGWRMFLGSLIFASGTMALGAIVYRLHGLDIWATTMVVGGAGWGAAKIARLQTEGQRFFNGSGLTAGLRSRSAYSDDLADDEALEAGWFKRLLGLGAVAVSLTLLWQVIRLISAAAVDSSIRSPWDAAPHQIFLLVFIAAAIVFIVAHGDLSPLAALAGGAAIAALIASVAALVYKIGFGFDPFLHRATEQMIFTDGSVSPKPLYYLGQYATVTLVARFLGGRVAQIDTALVPTALALAVPVAYYSLRRAFNLQRGQAAVGALAWLALPLSAFASTTPQGFADALFLITVFLALAASVGRFPLIPLTIIAAAAGATHPIAGVPLVLFIAVIALHRHAPERDDARFRAAWRIAPYILAAAGALALPTVFLINSLVSGTDVTISAGGEGTASLLEAFRGSGTPTRRYDLFLDFVYGWKAVRATAIFSAAVAGLVLLKRRGGTWIAWLLGALICLGNFLLLKTVVQFPFLIAYERFSYADRLYELALFLAAPLMCAAVAWSFARLTTAPAVMRMSAVTLASALLTASLYLAYPRRDQYEASRGWSTSASDVAAVRSIDDDADGRPYVVLANQSVSAAAVQEFGFRKYYDSRPAASSGPVFFYPIPTGGPLYELYLEMNSARGARQTALRAMDLAGVDTAYYVVSYYWWDAQRINVNSKKNADRAWAIGSDDFIFRYDR